MFRSFNDWCTFDNALFLAGATGTITFVVFVIGAH